VQSAYGGSDVSADTDLKKKKKKQTKTGAINDPECMTVFYLSELILKCLFIFSI
jgi:hypothetical protein